MNNLSGTLTISLSAIQENYKQLQSLCGSTCETAAVVKANAYGLGVSKVTPALYQAGARTYFVATLDEGIEIRELIKDAKIYTFNGFDSTQAPTYKKHKIAPILNSYEALRQYKDTGGGPAILNCDTGMNRLGLTQAEVGRVIDDPSTLETIQLDYVMSHFSSSEEPDNRRNEQQFDRFKSLMPHFRDKKFSLCNSEGIFRSSNYHCDLTRPGIALYGVGQGMQPVVSLSAPVLQIHSVKQGETAGYNETYTFQNDSNVAVIGAGYADGLPISLSNRGAVYWQGYRLPICGRVSMDLIICDLKDVPENQYPKRGDQCEVIGQNQTTEMLSKDAGIIPYVIFTSLGKRYKRTYIS